MFATNQTDFASVHSNVICSKWSSILGIYFTTSSLWPCAILTWSKLKTRAELMLFSLSQLQHRVPVYLLLTRAHSQSPGGAELREPPPASHHILSRPAAPGCPGALLLWTKGCSQEPVWQGEVFFTRPPTNPSTPLGLCFPRVVFFFLVWFFSWIFKKSHIFLLGHINKFSREIYSDWNMVLLLNTFLNSHSYIS